MRKKTKKNYRLGYDRATQFQLHTMMLPGTLLLLLFNIVPLFGLILAFKYYQVTDGIKGVFTSPWYGFQNFKIIFANHLTKICRDLSDGAQKNIWKTYLEKGDSKWKIRK